MAGAAFAEIQTKLRPELNHLVPWAINVAEMPGDQESIQQAQANLRSRQVGDIALGGTIETRAKPIRNVKEGLEWASEGDKDGIQMLDANILKEMSEYLFKAGNVSRVKLETDSYGRILQNGQLMQDVYRNGYQMASAHPVLKARSKAEANNGSRLERFYESGLLDTHTMVVFSRTADGLSDEELDELNFFSATKSVSIQATTNGPHGLTTETAFVAGVSEDGAERTDREVIEAIYEYFGIDAKGMTAEELINAPLLISNEYMKNGVIDLVKLYDAINGGTFFGQNAEQQNYLEYKEFCEKRERYLDTDKQAIRARLIVEKNRLPNAISVSKQLAKLVEEKLVKKAIIDESIDVRVFGGESAESIMAARMHSNAGNYELAMIHAQSAIRTATGGSCPSSMESLAKLLGIESSALNEERQRKSWHGYDDESETKYGTCKNCEKKNVKVGVASWCKSCIDC